MVKRKKPGLLGNRKWYEEFKNGNIYLLHIKGKKLKAEKINKSGSEFTKNELIKNGKESPEQLAKGMGLDLDVLPEKNKSYYQHHCPFGYEWVDGYKNKYGTYISGFCRKKGKKPFKYNKY